MEGRKLAKLSWNDWMDDTVDANNADDLDADWMSYVTLYHLPYISLVHACIDSR